MIRTKNSILCFGQHCQVLSANKADAIVAQMVLLCLAQLCGSCGHVVKREIFITSK